MVLTRFLAVASLINTIRHVFLSISFALLVILIPSFSSFIDTKGKLPTFLPFSIFPFFLSSIITYLALVFFFGLPSCRSVLRLLTNWIFFLSPPSFSFFFFFSHFPFYSLPSFAYQFVFSRFFLLMMVALGYSIGRDDLVGSQAKRSRR